MRYNNVITCINDQGDGVNKHKIIVHVYHFIFTQIIISCMYNVVQQYQLFLLHNYCFH